MAVMTKQLRYQHGGGVAGNCAALFVMAVRFAYVGVLAGETARCMATGHYR